ncbi:Putative metal-dependent hydrolase YfiT [Arenibacter antarcticus]|uniref:YfiT family bacillithiol transferase n=1 Tax=Arenibacter antarcticus TaxID=2040469 RepID=A0ABW5VMA5_9FLAO|nr:putative metal-dependent hydrolase [Arenibacter sp. H213]MCM4168732.1 putative metal-dependent hydrolase [Arenibacter sp. H213]
MEEKLLEQLRYPIGHFVYTHTVDDIIVSDWISELEALPSRLEDLVRPLTESQLNTPYRSGGWTVRQVVHHIGDSHHNSYTRFKWMLTEDKPVIKAYQEKDWSNLFDARLGPIDMSLDYIKALHVKLVFLLRGLTKEDLARVYIHPKGNVEVSLMENIGRYAWHGNHHLAHISGLKERNGW